MFCFKAGKAQNTCRIVKRHVRLQHDSYLEIKVQIMMSLMLDVNDDGDEKDDPSKLKNI